MKFKTVMVSLALDRPNTACLAVAGDLAERFEARVIGIAASDLRPPLYFAEGGFAQEVIEQEGRPFARLLELGEFWFGRKRAKSVEWRSPWAAGTLRHAGGGAADGRGRSVPKPSSIPASPRIRATLMEAGRPIIIVPPTVEWLDLRSAGGRRTCGKPAEPC